MKQTIKNIIDGIIMSGTLLISSIICVEGIITFNIPLAILTFPVMLVSADRLKSDIEGNTIRNSIFSVSRSGKITQDTLRNHLNFFKLLTKKDKQKTLITEEFKMFKQLKKFDKKGNIKTYHTLSQGLTVRLLKELQKAGFIENLTYEKVKKSKLFFEKILIGNSKKSKSKKNMYNISFNLTDKIISDDTIEQFFQASEPNQEENNPSISNGRNLSSEKTASIKPKSRQEQIEELKQLRSTLVDDSHQIVDENTHKL